MLKPWLALLLALAGLLTAHSRAIALADATIARLGVEGADLRDGDRVTVKVELANQGDSPLPPVPVVLSIDDEPYAEWKPARPIAPGKRATWSSVWTVTRGSHLVLAAADPLNDVAESDEANNTAFVNVGVGEVPEPTPWPALLAGGAALVLGFGAAALVKRALPAASGKARDASRRERNRTSP